MGGWGEEDASDFMSDVSAQRKNAASRAKDIVKGFVKDVTLGLLLPFVYSRAAKDPVDPRKVVFLESKQQEVPDSFRLLMDRLDADPRFDVLYVSLGQHRVSRMQYLANCADALRQIATARCVFLNDASDVVSCVALRPETRVVQLWHACGAFKKWGMSTADLEFGGSREQILRHPFYGNLSLVTVSSPEVAWAYAEAMVLEDRQEIIRPLGVSRTDVFFDEAFLSEARLRVRKAVPRMQDKKVMLYAPTFRGRVSKALGPDRLDVEAFREAFEDEWVLLVKHHPFVKERPAIPTGCASFAFDVSDSVTIEDALIAADVCISDYSSLVFEYSLFERPMVFFAYDKEEYDDWRGFYYEYEDLTPGPVFCENEPMIEYLQHIGQRFDKERVAQFRQRFMSACDGHSTDRIIQAVLDDGL